jgi:hypothetical protein
MSLLVLAFVALLVPVAIHLLVRAPARLLDFPSLRFVRAAPVRASRHRLLSDPGLLAVRMAIVAAAAAAFLETLPAAPWQHRAWNARLVRAVVVDARVATSTPSAADPGPSHAATRIDSANLADGVGRALSWLADAAPARRELVVVSDFPLGSVERLGLHAVPRHVGVRLVRAECGRPPVDVELRTMRAPEAGGARADRLLRVSTDAEVTQVRTASAPRGEAVRIEDAPGGVRLPDLALELVAAPADRLAVRAAAVAALQFDLPVAADAAARPVVVAGAGATLPPARALCAPWMGTVGRAIAADTDLSPEPPPASSSTQPGADGPWVVVLRGKDAVPLVRVAARAGDPCALLVHTTLAPSSVEWPLLVHRVLRARDPAPAFDAAESAFTTEADLRRLSRPPGEVGRHEFSQERRSGRLSWLAALGLLIAEWWLRRRRTPEEAQEADARAA